MNNSRRPFRLNRDEKKVIGVCAGIADHFDVDVTLVRMGMALAIILTFPLMLFGYFLLGAVAQSGGRRASIGPAHAPRLSASSVEATRQRMRDIDARMQAIETYVTSTNTQLAREIDDLR